MLFISKGINAEGWMEMKEKLIRFMQGRYGIDQLSKFLLITDWR